MASLPYLKYTNDFKNAYITSFGGIVSAASAYEGGMCDALNMSNYNFPALCVRLGFAGINMKDENGNEVIIDENILAVGGDDTGGGMLLCGETKLWYYSYDDGFWREFLYEKEISGSQRIVSWKREHITKENFNKKKKRIYRIYMLVPAKIIFVKTEVFNVESDNEEFFEKYFELAKIEDTQEDPFRLECGNVSTSGDFLNGYVGNGDGGAFKIYDGESVITTYAGRDLNESGKGAFRNFPNGIYVNTFLGKSEDDEEAKERFSMVRYKSYPGEVVYTSYGKHYYSTIVFAGEGGLEPSMLDPKPSSEPSGTSAYSGVFKMWIDVPQKVKGAFSHNNRLWAWDDENIYASSLGIYERFSVDGTDAGGWSVPFILGDKISAGISYMGHPVFFTQNQIITVYGEYPSNYSLSIFSAPGVLYGARDSLCECSGSLYYLSHAGVMRYGGNFPVKISDALKNISLKGGCGASDAQNYYLYARYMGADGEEKGVLFSYNINYGTWNIIDYAGSSSDFNLGGVNLVSPAMNFISDSEIGFAHVMIFNNNPNAYALLCAPSKEREPLFPGAVVRDGYFGYNDSYIWRARFGEFFLKSPNIKGILQVQLRARLISAPLKNESGLCEAGFKVKICYDGEDASLDGRDILDDTGFETIHTEIVAMDNDNIKYSGEEYRVRNILIPVAPRRFDSFKIEISGTGRWEISSLSFEYMVGSEKV